MNNRPPSNSTPSSPKKRRAHNSTLPIGESTLKRSPLKKVNSKRRRKASQIAFGEGGGKAAWIRSRRCALFGLEGCGRGAWSSTEAAHVKSRGAGGDSTHLIPLCRKHHHEQHQLGILTFARRYAVELDAMAVFYESEWQREGV
jgi:hypothetical protein